MHERTAGSLRGLMTLGARTRIHNPGCTGRLGCDLHNLASPEFRWGLVLGLVSVGISAALARAVLLGNARKTTGYGQSVRRVAGLPYAAAVMAGLAITGRLRFGLLAGVALLALGGTLIARRGYGLWTLALVPGSAVIAFGTGLPVPIWARAVVAAAPVVLAPVLDDIDQRAGAPAMLPVLVAVSVVGLYEAVPDPEQALVLLGASLPLVLLGWPRPMSGFGAAGSATTVGIVAWVAAIGGRGRLSAFVGGLVCLVVLVADPIARWYDRHHTATPRSRPRDARTRLVVAAIHLIPVYLASRVIGPLGSPPPVHPPPGNRIELASAMAVVLLILAALLAIALRRTQWRWPA